MHETGKIKTAISNLMLACLPVPGKREPLDEVPLAL